MHHCGSVKVAESCAIKDHCQPASALGTTELHEAVALDGCDSFMTSDTGSRKEEEGVTHSKGEGCHYHSRDGAGRDALAWQEKGVNRASTLPTDRPLLYTNCFYFRIASHLPNMHVCEA